MKRLVAPSLSVLMILLLHAPISCVAGGEKASPPQLEYRSLMRNLVMNISSIAKIESPGFLVLPQNGQELFTANGQPDGDVESIYLGSIDGTGREDLFYGYVQDDHFTPELECLLMRTFLDIGESYGVEALVTDYCWTQWKMDSSYVWNQAAGYISFASDSRGLDGIPSYPVEPWGSGDHDVIDLSDARNFLYLINPGNYSSRSEFVTALAATDYDCLIIDLFWNDEQLSAEDVSSLSIKPRGGERLVLAYMSIGEAEDYRYYWEESWSGSPPAWLHDENPEWEGNYLIEYWDPEWWNIILNGDDSYLIRIVNAGFDGVYLDKVDSFESWEDIDEQADD